MPTYPPTLDHRFLALKSLLFVISKYWFVRYWKCSFNCEEPCISTLLETVISVHGGGFFPIMYFTFISFSGNFNLWFQSFCTLFKLFIRSFEIHSNGKQNMARFWYIQSSLFFSLWFIPLQISLISFCTNLLYVFHHSAL